MKKDIYLWFSLAAIFLSAILFFVFPRFLGTISYEREEQIGETKNKKTIVKNFPPLDTALYDQKLEELANNPPPKKPTTKVVKDSKTGVETTITIPPKPAPPNLWPVKTIYPNPGAILPFKRIVAYYGNLYSTKMGVLGQYKEDEMLEWLGAEVKKWEEADPVTPVVPALHYIAVVAQGAPGVDGKYRARMPSSEIEKILAIAEKIPARNASGIADAGGDAIVFLDLQVGFSNLQIEVPLLQKYLKLPNVHLGIDAEFSMKGEIRPGKVVGTLDATDINFTTDYLAKIVQENNLPPKILVVHRYTQKMITNYQMIKTLPEVQIVMHMDGWGGSAKKKNTYEQFIYKEPVQFTGFKLFYKNDVFEPGTVLMTPLELLELRPRPIYIQYQ